MAGNLYWADNYVQKRCTAEDAIGHIRPGQRVFIGSSCGEPQHLVKTLAEATAWFTDLEIVRLMSLETAPLSLIANRTRDQRLNIRSFTSRTRKGSLHGVYRLRLEETLEIVGQTITIRPAKPVDERRIQEHFYTLDKDDIVSRFFHEKTSFVTDDVGAVSQVDYIENLSILAVVGEFGFGKVVGIGEYLLDPSCNLAEVAFSVSSAWQGKGLGKRLMTKLFEGARDNGIAGFTAYTAPDNQGMISLFNSLPVHVFTAMEDGMAALSCRFDDIKTN